MTVRLQCAEETRPAGTQSIDPATEAAVRAGRAAFMRQIDPDYRRRIAQAVEDFCTIIATDDAQQRLRAFAEKSVRKNPI